MKVLFTLFAIAFLPVASRADLSFEADPGPRAVRAGRRGRHHRARARAGDEAARELGLRGREPPGRQRLHRHHRGEGRGADGYTLLMAHTGEFAVNPALFDNVPYELERDFMPITMVSDSPMLYLATAKAPFNTFQELVAQAKAKPGSISYGSAGNGSINHLAGEWLAQAAGIQLLRCALQGRCAAAAAVAAGDVQFGVMAAPGAIPHIKSGRGKVIGITTAKKSPLDPSWATPRDAGIPDSTPRSGSACRAERHAAGDRRPGQQGSARDARSARSAEELHREGRRRGDRHGAGRIPGAHQGRCRALQARVQKAGVRPERDRSRVRVVIVRLRRTLAC